MLYYKNLNGNSNIESYDIGLNYISVKFQNSCRIYTYSYNKAGRHNVDQMKLLAIQGYGLNSYIQHYVKYLYD